VFVEERALQVLKRIAPFAHYAHERHSRLIVFFPLFLDAPVRRHASYIFRQFEGLTREEGSNNT